MLRVFIFLAVQIHLLNCKGHGCRWAPGENLRYFIRVPEDAHVGQTVLTVNVTQPELLVLTPDKPEDSPFFLSSSTGRHGRIVVAAPLEALLKNSRDAESPVLKYSLTCGLTQIPRHVSIYIEDVNNHRPEFLNQNMTINLDELTPVGLPVLSELRAVDKDKANTPNSDFQFSIYSGNSGGHFAMADRKKGTIVLAKRLDFDAGVREYLLQLLVQDKGNPSLSSFTWVTFRVTDADDLDPMFTHALYTAHAQEHPGPPDVGTSVAPVELRTEPGQIHAYDADVGVNADLIYSLVENEWSETFHVDPESGLLFLTGHLDRESLTRPVLTLHVRAEQQDNPARQNITTVLVRVDDVNDNLPKFDHDVYAISIVENLPSGFSVVQVVASDPDEGENGAFSYYIEGGQGAIDIDSSSGWLTIANHSVLDREASLHITLDICTLQVVPLVRSSSYPTSTLEPDTSSWTLEDDIMRVTTLRPSFKRPLLLSASPNRRSFSLTSRRDLHSDEAGDFGRVLPRSRATRRQRSAEELQPARISQRRLQEVPGTPSGTEDDKSCAVVELTLLDSNDNNPIFIPSREYVFFIRHDVIKIGDVIGKVLATDEDAGTNGQVVYHLQRSFRSSSKIRVKEDLPFEIDKDTGDLRILAKPEGDTLFFVEASDLPLNPSETRSSLAIVKVIAKDDRRLEPHFVGSPFEFWIGNDAPVGTSVGQIRVRNMEERGRSYDMLHSYREGVPFAVEESSGIISVISPLEGFPRTSYDFDVVVKDKSRIIKTNLTIRVALLPNATSRSDSTINFKIPENMAGGFVGDVAEELKMFGVRLGQGHHLELVSPDAKEWFTLDEDGKLYTAVALDYEKQPHHNFIVVSTHTSDIFYIYVQVEDVNDNPPQMNAVLYSGSIEENSPPGTKVAIFPRIQVSDADSHDASRWRLELQGSDAPLFSIGADLETVLFVGGPLDREVTPVYELTLEARDEGGLASWANLTIFVEDANDNVPHFLLNASLPAYGERLLNITSTPFNFSLTETEEEIASLSVTVPEYLPVGSQVTQVVAEDEDADVYGTVRYDIVDQVALRNLSQDDGRHSMTPVSAFAIDPSRGTILLSSKLWSDQAYVLNVSATDGGDLTSYVTLVVSSYDVNDHEPRFSLPLYQFEIMEGEYLVGEIGRVVATDDDRRHNAVVHFYIESVLNASSFPFRVVHDTGVILATGVVDRETRDRYAFKVVAEDQGDPRLSSSADVVINVKDVNDNRPEFLGYQDVIYLPSGGSPTGGRPSSSSSSEVVELPVFQASVLEKAPRKTVVTRVTARDEDLADSSNAVVLFKLYDESGSFAVNPDDGTVFTTAVLSHEDASRHNVTLLCYDLGSPSLSSTALLQIDVLDVPEDEGTARIFEDEEFQILVPENSETPRLVLNLSSSIVEPEQKLYFELRDQSMEGIISVDALSGEVFLLRSLDREEKDTYTFRVKALNMATNEALRHVYRASSDLAEATTPQETPSPTTPEEAPYPTTNAPPQASNASREMRQLGHFSHSSLSDPSVLEPDEVLVRMLVKDVNDNAPEFVPPQRPFVGAAPSSARPGHPVIKITAKDADIGINGEVRYSIVAAGNEGRFINEKFSINSISGQISVAGSLERYGGQVFSLDVEATDSAGSPKGLRSRVQLFIYVTNSLGQLLVLEIGAPLSSVEPHLTQIQSVLSDVSNLEIRIQKITAKKGGSRDAGTNIYLYGVDSASQNVVDSEVLQKSLKGKEEILHRRMPSGIRVKSLKTRPVQEKQYIMQGPELIVLTVAIVVFFVTVLIIICICYKHRKNRRNPTKVSPLVASGGLTVAPVSYQLPLGNSYVHMSEHSSTDSTESTENDQSSSGQSRSRVAGRDSRHSCQTRDLQGGPSGGKSYPSRHLGDDSAMGHCNHFRKKRKTSCQRPRRSESQTEEEEGERGQALCSCPHLSVLSSEFSPSRRSMMSRHGEQCFSGKSEHRHVSNQRVHSCINPEVWRKRSKNIKATAKL